MDQTTTLSAYDRRRSVSRLADFIVQSIEGARAVEKPFFHLEFDRVFPNDIYAQILTLMPDPRTIDRCTDAARGTIFDDGTHTRVKIDLFPEYIATCRPRSALCGMSSAARFVVICCPSARSA